MQLQYDEPLNNQVVGRLTMDGTYAPTISKIYRNNCEIARPRYSFHYPLMEMNENILHRK